MAASSFSILMVEDDLAARNILVNMMEIRFRGCTIHTADNGRQGVQLFKEHRPDLVITDITMPEMDGIEMAREIKAIDPDATFIVMTAFGDEDFFRSFSELGVRSYLLKPLNFKELFTSIDKCLAEKNNP